MKIAKKIQGSLPIIGLVSRLAAPEGGFDELVRLGCIATCSELHTASSNSRATQPCGRPCVHSTKQQDTVSAAQSPYFQRRAKLPHLQAYPEFCRSVFDKAPPAMGIAMQDLEKRHGKVRIFNPSPKQTLHTSHRCAIYDVRQSVMQLGSVCVCVCVFCADGHVSVGFSHAMDGQHRVRVGATKRHHCSSTPIESLVSVTHTHTHTQTSGTLSHVALCVDARRSLTQPGTTDKAEQYPHAAWCCHEGYTQGHTEPRFQASLFSNADFVCACPCVLCAVKTLSLRSTVSTVHVRAQRRSTV